MHVAEQPREVESCLAEHGRRPVELLHELGLLDARFTAVHAVHLAPHEIPLLGRSNICACPLTERDLGDGILPADALAAAGATLCIGTDGQSEIDPLGELRALEGDLRLERGRRLVLPPTGEGPDALARTLLEVGTRGGAASLGLDVGRLAPGRPADLCAVDLAHPALAGAPEDGLLAAVVFSAPATAVTDTWVQGQRLVQDGHHPRAEAAARDFRALCRRTFA
jgi:formimidoylglutamate deiminase